MGYTKEAVGQYLYIKENIGESLNNYQHNLKIKEFEGLFQGAGGMKVKGLNQLAYKVYLSNEITCIPQVLHIFTLFYAIMLPIVHFFRPTACINRAIAEGIEEDILEESDIIIIYCCPCYLHLLSLAWIFTSFAYYKVSYIQL